MTNKNANQRAAIRIRGSAFSTGYFQLCLNRSSSGTIPALNNQKGSTQNAVTQVAGTSTAKPKATQNRGLLLGLFIIVGSDWQRFSVGKRPCHHKSGHRWRRPHRFLIDLRPKRYIRIG
jgi:hypothetical protein